MKTFFRLFSSLKRVFAKNDRGNIRIIFFKSRIELISGCFHTYSCEPLIFQQIFKGHTVNKKREVN